MQLIQKENFLIWKTFSKQKKTCAKTEFFLHKNYPKREEKVRENGLGFLWEFLKIS